jgi:hypothetical protein
MPRAYDSLLAAWTSLVGANNTLIQGHLIAHSFLVVACATLLAASNPPGTSGIVLTVASAAGLQFAVLTSATWARNTAQAKFIDWRLQQLERKCRDAANARGEMLPPLFTDLDHLGKGLCVKSDVEGMRPFNPNWAWRQSSWLKPVRFAPIILSVVYGAFLWAALTSLQSSSAYAIFGAALATALSLSLSRLVYWRF